ncbi:class I SAM-dependent methyltransferase [bacterium]|nr:class I SAM-dependent methyltransferase [bacterium]
MIRSLLARLRPLPADPYDGLAGFYDRMMSHVDYRGWAAFVHEIIQGRALQAATVIDAGCGTGTLMSWLRGYGYEVYGFDRSLPMLEAAGGKGIGGTFQADLKDLPLAGSADVLLCLYDTIQYLPPDAVPRFMAQAYGAVRGGGMFVFDVVTERHVKEFWDGYSETDRGGSWRCSRKGWYDPERRIQHTEISLFSGNRRRSCKEHHRQFIYRLDALAAWAREAGWTAAECLHEFTFQPGSEDSGRVHFLLQREEP